MRDDKSKTRTQQELVADINGVVNNGCREGDGDEEGMERKGKGGKK